MNIMEIEEISYDGQQLFQQPRKIVLQATAKTQQATSNKRPLYRRLAKVAYQDENEKKEVLSNNRLNDERVASAEQLKTKQMISDDQKIFQQLSVTVNNVNINDVVDAIGQMRQATDFLSRPRLLLFEDPKAKINQTNTDLLCDAILNLICVNLTDSVETTHSIKFSNKNSLVTANTKKNQCLGSSDPLDMETATLTKTSPFGVLNSYAPMTAKDPQNKFLGQLILPANLALKLIDKIQSFYPESTAKEQAQHFYQDIMAPFNKYAKFETKLTPSMQLCICTDCKHMSTHDVLNKVNTKGEVNINNPANGDDLAKLDPAIEVNNAANANDSDYMIEVAKINAETNSSSFQKDVFSDIREQILSEARCLFSQESQQQLSNQVNKSSIICDSCCIVM